MHTKKYTLILFLLCLLLVNCESDGIDCVMVSGECVPRYVFPPTNAQEGEKYYHAKLGVITFKTGNWTNTKGVIITAADLLIE